MSYLVEIFLPVLDPTGVPFGAPEYAAVRKTLLEKFGGLTGWSRSLAEGVWRDDQGASIRDELVIYDVMVPTLECEWWVEFRRKLEARFRQESILIRAQPVERV